MNKIKKITHFMLIIIFGACILETIFIFPNDNLIYKLIISIFSLSIGISLIVYGIKKLYVEIPHKLDSSNKKSNVDALSFFPTVEDKTTTEKLLTDFRKSYYNYYKNNQNINHDNEPLADYVSRIYENILKFRKNRMNENRIGLSFISERKKYGNIKPIRTKNYFDGRYEITEIEETISAKSIYYNIDNNKIYYTKSNSETAFYSLINTHNSGDGKVICPNCGATSTQMQLINGCPFCQTKFTLEDFNTKFSNFALIKDFDVQYEKFNIQSERIKFWTIIIIIALFGLISSTLTNFISNIVLKFVEIPILAIILFKILATCSLTFLLTKVFQNYFNNILMPTAKRIKTIGYHTIKSINNLEKERSNDDEIENQIKSFDSYFSINSFYANIQNKISSVIFASNENQINVFSLTDLSKLLNRYKNVIDISFNKIFIKKFEIKDELQYAYLTVYLDLFKLENGKMKKSIEKIYLTCTRDKNCLTRILCEPSVLECKGCGASISILNGKNCEYCGRALNFEDFDWIIREYRVF